MKPLAFFRTPEVAKVLGRAARCTSTVVSLHTFERGKEGLRITGQGQCAACTYVAGLRGGNSACRRSRESAAVDAQRLKALMPFFCHMGFACIRVFPLLEEAPGFVLTFGPYCPPEGAGSIETSALEGLSELGAAPDAAFARALTDVPELPVVTVPGIVEWTIDALQELWVRFRVSDESDGSDGSDGVLETGPVDSEEAALRPRRRAKSHAVSPDPYRAGPIAAALAGGAQNQARALVRAVLDETRSGQRARIAVKRARMLALVGAVFEAAERAEIDTAPCRARLPQFLEEVERARTDLRLADAAMRLLSILKRKVARDAALVPKLNLGTSGNDGYAELNAILLPRLVDGITLNEVAAKLGQHPTAITHRLQRKFGMSFSEYIGRLRVDRAKELLRRTRLTVTEVARRVGISDTSNFAKLFHKFESMSPVKYREQFGKKR